MPNADDRRICGEAENVMDAFGVFPANTTKPPAGRAETVQTDSPGVFSRDGRTPAARELPIAAGLTGGVA